MVVKNTLDIQGHLRFSMTDPWTYTTKTPNLKGYLPGYLGIVMNPMGSNPYPFSHRFQWKTTRKNARERILEIHPFSTEPWLLGGWTNPSEKYESCWKSSPIFGVKIKHIWNHHLDDYGRKVFFHKNHHPQTSKSKEPTPNRFISGCGWFMKIRPLGGILWIQNWFNNEEMTPGKKNV